MLSQLYDGTVHHDRAAPGHRFNYPVWYLYLDLDELNDLDSISLLFSVEGFNFTSLKREDYLKSELTLKQAVYCAIYEHKAEVFDGKVFLLTMPRQLGYAMNPLSLFYCFDSAGDLRFVVGEVHNTPWNERFTYVLDMRNHTAPGHEKTFHVSPFMPMNVNYYWHFNRPDDGLNVSIKLVQQDTQLMKVSLRLKRTEFTRRNLLRLLFRHGWQALNTTFRIYWQATILWLKHATFYQHPKTTQNLMRKHQ